MQPWWTIDPYTDATPLPDKLLPFGGPKGIALVRAWPDGRTDPGWGLEGKEGAPGFMERYTRGTFNVTPVLFGFEHECWNFAFVMRSMKLVCIDIDGKNGGLQHAGKLGMLPLTLAETSKSGNGYHLFYSTTEDSWDPVIGFAEFNDRIGIEQGVDIRATGCVFHHPQQRWNNRHIAELPLHLKDRLMQRQQVVAAQSAAILKILDNEDMEEVALMHDALLDDLRKPIPAGRRNTTLFAIGTQLKLAQVPNWEVLLSDRAAAVGLDVKETTKLVRNIQKYGV